MAGDKQLSSVDALKKDNAAKDKEDDKMKKTAIQGRTKHIFLLKAIFKSGFFMKPGAIGGEKKEASQLSVSK